MYIRQNPILCRETYMWLWKIEIIKGEESISFNFTKDHKPRIYGENNKFEKDINNLKLHLKNKHRNDELKQLEEFIA